MQKYLRPSLLLSKNIYTTGLTGFIGKNLLPVLLEDYDFVINFERDNKIRIHTKNSQEPYKVTQSLIKKYTSKEIIHLATLYDPLPSSAESLKKIVKSNIFFLVNILEDFFPSTQLDIINICSYHQLLDTQSQNPYSLAKGILSVYLKNSQHKVKNIYLFDTFGPNDNRRKVVDIFIKSIITNKPIIIPKNDIYINISHVSSICQSILKSQELSQGEYSIASPNTLSLEELAKLIMKIIGSDVEIEKNGIAPDYFNFLKKIPQNIFLSPKSNSLENELLSRVNEIK